MKQRPQTEKVNKRKIDFLSNQSQNDMNQSHKKTLKQVQIEFILSKAKEFESFKQIPKFTKTRLGVIHPSPVKIKKEPSHIPPRTLLFDG